MITTTTIKRGDSVQLTLDLGINLTSAGYTNARVVMRQKNRPVVVDRPGIINGDTVIITLSEHETAVPGNYFIEVEMTPGPHTYPSDKYGLIKIINDLDTI